MRNQRNACRILADTIAEKVQEYINESESWIGLTYLWVDGNSAEVNLGSSDEDYPGLKEPVSEFICDDDEGNPTVDYDKIEEYAYSWFDFRLG